MKLISCYIENFGGLRDFSLDFAEGLTVVQQPNGFGKTTLAEFIRAMFYGFPRRSPRQLGKRQKYRPWNGEKCRGQLTFEHEGKRYRIERSFGATPKGDECRIFDLDTGRQTERFTAEIGVELFGLDADSFERSTYLPQSRETGPMTTDSIRAKLSGLVEDTDDVGNFEKAMGTLRARRSALVPYRGQGGAVAEDTGRITRLQQALDSAEESARDCEKTAAELKVLEAEQTRVAAEIDAVRRDFAAASEAALRQSHHLRLAQMKADLTRTQACLEGLEQKYPRGMPDADALDAVTDAVERAGRLAAAPELTDADRQAERFVEENRERFAAGVPDEEEFDRVYQLRDQHRAVSLRLDAAVLSREEQEERAALDDFFAPGMPQAEYLAEREADLEEAARLRRENLKLASRTVEMPRYKVPSPLTVPVLLGGGVLAVLAAIFHMIHSRPVSGWVLLVAGVLALAAAGYLQLRGAMTRQVNVLSPQDQQQVRENEEKAAALEREARAFTAAYGGTAPAEIRRRMDRLTALAQREAALARLRRELAAQAESLDGQLREFFAAYGFRGDGDAYETLNRLRRTCETWERARKQLEEKEQRAQAYARQAEQVRQTLEAFREAYAAAPRTREQVLALRDDVRQYGELTTAARTLKEQISQYRHAHADALAEPVPDVRGDPDDLRRREAELLARQNRIGQLLLRLRQREERQRAEADRVGQLRAELEHWQAKKQTDRENAALLDDTMEFLSQARDELSRSYMGTIRQRFAALLARMTGEDPGNILVTPELEVRLERGGVSRELGYFSAGQTDLVRLCMRLALVDALFREAKPFVILDDPFVNLDDERTARALALLRQLGRERQIIYLVCNSSRVSESFGT